MTTILIIVHVLIALLLIGTVLIQRGQGADMGVSFGGGGAQTLFGSRGSGSFLGKLTGGLAAAFMMTSLTLAFFLPATDRFRCGSLGCRPDNSG